MKNQKGRGKKTPEPISDSKPRIIGRFIRVFLLLGVLFTIALAIGSVFIRAEVIRLVRDRTLTSSSLVMSSPTVISRGVSYRNSRIPERLARLGYLKVSGKPDKPGEYNESQQAALIYLRGGKFAQDIDQAPLLVRLDLSTDDTISALSQDRIGRELTEVYLEPESLSRLSDTETRASIPKHLQEYPQSLIDAIIAIEDERFYSHFGIDPIGIARAVVANLVSHKRQGGSTITQQLAKNLFLSPERTLARKMKEAVAAVCLETAFTKDQILELYMNEVFLGQEGNVAIHGFGEASKAFFGKDAKDLSVAESATLAALNKAPTNYSPRLNPDNSQQRRNLVLAKMQELGKITDQERRSAEKEPLLVRPAERARRVAPYFVDYVRSQVSQIVDNSHWEDTPLRIITGLDMEYQQCAEAALSKGIRNLETKFPRLTKGAKPLQGAIIAVNPVRGDILAWVGGRDYGINQFDRISQSKRQPGSTFKPFVYLTALDKNLNNYRVARTTTILMDEPVEYEIPGSSTWQPKNFDGKFRGPVTVREALTHSLNVPTVELAQKVGIDAVQHTAALFGFGENLPKVPSLALGAGEVSPLGLSRAYATIANGGILLDLVPIRSVIEADTKSVLFAPETPDQNAILSSGLPSAKGFRTTAQTPSGSRVASESAVYVLTTMLRSVIEEGTARSVRTLGFKAPAAGKTGTSNDTRDAWFSGFTPHLLAIVWVGFDDNKELKLTGGQAAAPIWTDFMKCVSPFEPPLDFIPPPGVITKEVDRTTGLIFTGACNPSDRINEVFVEGTEPVTPCTHGSTDYSDEASTPESEFGTNTIPDSVRSPLPSTLPQSRDQSGFSLGPETDFQPRGRPYSSE